MYCPFCGVENKDDANFCHNCGQQIPKLNPQPKKENALKGRILLYAVSAIAVVGVLLALIFGLKSCQSNDDPKEHTVATEQAQRGVTRAPSADMELSLESAESLIRKELRDRLREVASVRLKRVRDSAVLTVWETGSEEPSIEVVAGDSATAFEMANQNMAGRGRGRLMVRELCEGVERNRYMNMNETTYHIPLFGKDGAKK